jgi:L-ascorbate metabolism protein UlaG (beta-lactamase superfamily)
MHLRWLGQSAFRLSGAEGTVVIAPFGSMEAAKSRGIRFAYPPIEGVDADLVLVTHEHGDHNAAEVVGGSPQVIRSTAGTLESPIGEVVAIASEHDDAAGTQRGPNTIFVFALGDVRVCHFGDFGQGSLRPEQRAAIGAVDMLLVPVGGGPTIGADGAAAVVETLKPRWTVPMHYRSAGFDVEFVQPVDPFLDCFESVLRLDGPEIDTGKLPGERAVVVPAVPV